MLYIGKAAATALQAIRPRDAFTGARPVFGIRSGRSVSNRIRAAAKAARLDGNYSGHSPRVGMAVDLAAAGVGLPALQVAGRWASPAMPGRYAAAELASRGARSPGSTARGEAIALGYPRGEAGTAMPPARPPFPEG